MLGDFYVEIPALFTHQKLTIDQDPYEVLADVAIANPSHIVELNFYEPGALEPEIIERCMPRLDKDQVEPDLTN